jgi:hypothetical protein
MARSGRGSSGRRSQSSDDRVADGPGGFWPQIGTFDTGNGLPFGPIEIALAIAAALLIYPVMRVIRMVRRR